MADWLVAVAFVALTWGFQAFAARRRSAGRAMPPTALLPLMAVLAGLAIGDWWAPALALAGLPGGVALNWNRERLRLREAAVGSSVDALLLALGCVLHAAVW